MSKKETVRASEEHTAERPLSPPFELSSERVRRPATSPHSHKFHAVTAALAGVAVGAIVVAVLVLVGGNNRTASTTPWSSWAPDDHGSLGTREIADHLAPLYRISAVDQLAVVTVVNLTNPSSAASAATTTTSSSSSSNGLEVAVRADPSSSAVSVLGGKTVAYNLCGIGASNCSIGVGQPSADRLLLLRREALELALYTFKYISGIQNVVAILPPGKTTQTSTLSPKPPSSNASTKPFNAALLFLKGELNPWLSEPLAATLPEEVPPTVAQMRSAPEAGLVEQITARGLFQQNLVQAQDGSSLLVLDPLPPQ